MNCEQLQDQLVPYLLGELSSDEVLDIESHLSSDCVNCHRELEVIRDALGLVFAAVPEARMSPEQRHHIARQAVGKTSPDSRQTMNWSTTVETPGSLTYAIQPATLLQSLLAIAAGFFLMLGWQAVTSSERPAEFSTGGHVFNLGSAERSSAAMSGDSDLLPGSHQHVRYVSLKSQPTQSAVHGYCLADTFSGQLHIIGNFDRDPPSNEHFRLTLVTATDVIEVPMAVDETGLFKKIIPLPDHVIREILLHVTSTVD